MLLARHIQAIIILSFLLLSLPMIASASTYYFAWDKDVYIDLSAYNTKIKFADTTYFDSFTWDNTTSHNVTFSNIGSALTDQLTTFGIELHSANATFTMLDSDLIEFNLDDTTNSSYVLTSKPNTVELNGVEYSEGSNWTWITTNSTLQLWTTGSVNVTFSYGLSLDIAVAIGLLALVIALCAVSMAVLRRKRD